MNKKSNCVLCDKGANRSNISGKDASLVNCDVCGTYVLDNLFESFYEAIPREERAMLSAHTRMCFELRDARLKLEDPADFWDEIVKNQHKTFDEKVENLILYIRIKSKEFGDYVKCNAEKDRPITCSLNPQEFEEIQKLAIDKGLIICKAIEEGLKLTKVGWKMSMEIMNTSPILLEKK